MNFTATLWAVWNEHSKEFSFHAVISTADMSSEGWIWLESKSVEFSDPDPHKIQGKLISALRKKLQAVRAENHRQEMELEEKINDLLALEAPDGRPETD